MPTTKQAPVMANPSGRGKPAPQNSSVFTGQVLPLPIEGPAGKWPTTAKLGDGTWFVWLDKITDTTMTFEVGSNSGCGDPMACTKVLGVQTLPFASRNTPTVVFLGSYPDSTTGALTAPAWAFAKMYNAGGSGVNLSAMNFGPSYTLPVPTNSLVSLPNSRVDDGYTTITVTNGKITYLR